MTHRTQVAIIGGGPAGLMLSHILASYGIDSIVLERQTRAYVMGRIRAGVLEHGSVQMLRDFGLAGRMEKEGKAKDGSLIVWQDRDDHFIDVRKWTGKHMWAWGQTYITEDLYAARESDGGHIIDEAQHIALHDIEGSSHVTFKRHGEDYRVDCDFIAGCDGFHGPSRHAIPAEARREYEQVYPFGWLGILTERPPLPDFVYCYHADGMAVAAQRNLMLSRALRVHYLEGSDQYLDCYSDMALRRIWASANISWRLTKMLHVFPGEDPFEQKIRENDYDLLLKSEPAQHALAHE